MTLIFVLRKEKKREREREREREKGEERKGEGEEGCNTILNYYSSISLRILDLQDKSHHHPVFHIHT
jgi:hypothetical protein